MPSISIIDSLPNFVTSEQHPEQTGSTPASFADIPPVLRHKEENVNVNIDPPLSELSGEELSKGTLYVIERCELPILFSYRISELIRSPVDHPASWYSSPSHLDVVSRSTIRLSSCMLFLVMPQARMYTASLRIWLLILVH